MHILTLMIYLVISNLTNPVDLGGAIIVAPLNPTPTAPPIQPDSFRTPGQALTVSAVQVCARGYAKVARNVPERVKMAVLHLYGMTSGKGYEIDHLISLELGGSNNPANLWPESYFGPWNAHIKDRLEDKLHELVCKGTLDLPEAQHDIATNWIYTYIKYLGEPNHLYQAPSDTNTVVIPVSPLP